MKGLLHSKIFRRNLGKWLCMYVGAILLLTTVVTYSKYLMGTQGADESKPAKFSITVGGLVKDSVTGKEDIITEAIDLQNRRPNVPLTFDIQVGTELEAAASFNINLYVNKDFEIISISERNIDNTYTEKCNKKTSACVIQSTTTNGNQLYNLKTISKLNPEKNKYTYKVVVKYSGTDTTFAAEHEYNDIVSVVYNATQIVS